MSDEIRAALSSQPSFIDEELAADFKSLQAAILVETQEAIVVCMSEAAYEYEPLDASVFLEVLGGLDPVPNLYAGHAEQALGWLEFQQNGRVGNEVPIQGLQDESPEYLSALDICSQREADKRPHPLDDESLWFNDASERSSERTAADPRLVEATSNATRCEREALGGLLIDIQSSHGDRAVDVVQRFDSKQLDLAEAVGLLHQLDDEERAVADAATPCVLDRLVVERTVYLSYIEGLADAEVREMELFMLELRSTMGSYAELMESLEGS